MATELPTFVRREQEKFENALKTAQAETEPEAQVTDTPLPPEGDVPTEPEPRPQVEPEPAAELGAADAAPDDQPAGDTEPAPQPVKGDWEQKCKLMEHKYKTLQGMYDVDAIAVGRANKRLKADNEALKRQMEAAKAAPVPEKTPQKPAPVTPDAVSDDEVKATYKASTIEDFGMEYLKEQIAAIHTVAAASSASAPAPPAADDSRIESLEQRLEQQAHAAYLSELEQLVPNWREIHNSAEWKEGFLGQVDRFSRKTYEELLSEAFNEYDAVRTAEFFDHFISLQSGTKPRVNPTAGREVPRTAPAAVASAQPKTTMTLGEYNERMRKLPTLGLSPVQLAERVKELEAVLRDGRVVDDRPGQTAQVPFV